MTNKSQSASHPVRLGVAGLGRAFVLTEAALRNDPRIELVAACAPRAESRSAFEQQFPGSRSYAEFSALCADGNVEAIYIATPHALHAAQVCEAAAAGKHILVEKPLAIALDDARQMVDAVTSAGVTAVVGPSHSFDAPVAQASALINDGAYGQARMIQAFNYTDFLYRPRRPEELRTDAGGGVMFSQAIHQIDAVRRLAGQNATRVYARTGNWDPARNTEGAYTAMIDFDQGLTATLTYSGYAHFDSDSWMDWASELGQAKPSDQYGRARRALKKVDSPEQEASLKSTRTFGAAGPLPQPKFHEHFGPMLVSMDSADLRLTANGVHVYADETEQLIPAAAMIHPRTPVVDALFDAVRHEKKPLQDLAWGMASLEICHAILASAKSGDPVPLLHQSN